MGQSTDAILCFGVEIGGDDDGFEGTFGDRLEEFDDSIDEYISRRFKEAGGVTGDWRSNPNYGDELRAAQKEFGIELITHCSGEYPMYILAIHGTSQEANRGYPITPTFEQPSQEQIDKLIAFCKEHEIEAKPTWILCSYWG